MSPAPELNTGNIALAETILEAYRGLSNIHKITKYVEFLLALPAAFGQCNLRRNMVK